MRRLVGPLLAAMLVGGPATAPLHAADTEAAAGTAGPFEIAMVTWRGCEDACRGFGDHLESVGVEADITILDAEQDRERLPAIVAEVRTMDPDLLVTWGTTVTSGVIGTLDGDGADHIDDIPAVFMIVADPVGANIIESYSVSGRPLVTGTHNRVPEATQMQVLADYLPFDRVGVIYNDDELNARLKAEEVQRVGVEQGFEVVERVLASDVDGAPLAEDIEVAVADMATADVDLIYVGSSSFLLANSDLLTEAALEHRLPVATAYEQMVRDSHGLIALASAYYNVGRLAGFQAEQILADGAVPGDLEVLGLDRYSVIINMDTARALELYPPLLLLRYAEVVEPGSR